MKEMKKLILMISAVSGIAAANAQSVELGNQSYYYERYQSSETNFHKTIAQQPNNAEAWYGLTRAYLAQEEIKKITWDKAARKLKHIYHELTIRQQTSA